MIYIYIYIICSLSLYIYIYYITLHNLVRITNELEGKWLSATAQHHVKHVLRGQTNKRGQRGKENTPMDGQATTLPPLERTIVKRAKCCVSACPRLGETTLRSRDQASTTRVLGKPGRLHQMNGSGRRHATWLPRATATNVIATADSAEKIHNCTLGYLSKLHLGSLLYASLATLTIASLLISSSTIGLAS